MTTEIATFNQLMVTSIVSYVRAAAPEGGRGVPANLQVTKASSLRNGVWNSLIKAS
jgi:hypothetical protein